MAPPKLLTRPFALLMLANLLLSLCGSLMIHFPGRLLQLGAGEATIGRVLALLAFTAAVLSPWVGRIIDRRGRRIVVRTGTVLMLIAATGYVLIDAIGPTLYVVRVIDGTGATMLYAAMFTYAADLVPAERRTEGLALFGASGMVTMAVSSLLGDLILSVAGYRELFLTALGFCAAGSAFCWMLPDPPRAAQVAGAAAPLLQTVRQRDLLPIWPAAMAFFGSMAALLGFMKTYVLHTGHSVSTFFTTYVLCALGLRVFFGGLPDRIGLRRMVLPAIGSYALGIAVLASSASSVALALAGALCGVGHAYAFPVLLSLVVSRTPAAARGMATATFTMVDWTGNLIAPPLLGWLIEGSGYAVAFGALSATGLLGVVAFYALDRPHGASATTR